MRTKQNEKEGSMNEDKEEKEKPSAGRSPI
jgi:hypothetical protein